MGVVLGVFGGVVYVLELILEAMHYSMVFGHSTGFIPIKMKTSPRIKCYSSFLKYNSSTSSLQN